MMDLTGRTLGQYQIVEEIGHGGMANVYRAIQPSMSREVAIKVLPAHFLQDRTFLERFTREVKVMARLQHPHILPVYDAGEENGLPYIVMAYMKGGTLADRIRESQGGLPLDEVVRLVDQIAKALDFAHRHGIIHRDFKPSNVLLDTEGNTYLADFGIAKATETTAQLTGSGIVGTPAYMAPEMSEPGEPSLLVDVYALGVTLFQMLVGKQPYEAPTPMGLLMAHVAQPIPDVRHYRSDLPDAVQTVIVRAMAKEPRARYQSAGALAADLSAAAGGAPLAAAGPESQWSAVWEAPTMDESVATPRPQIHATQQPVLPQAAPATSPVSVSPSAQRSFGSLVWIGGAVGVFLLLCVLVALGLAWGLPQILARSAATPMATAPNTSVPVSDAAPPTPMPTAIPTSTPVVIEPTATEYPTSTPDLSSYEFEIEQAIVDFDREMRYLLENCDTSRIATEALGKALQDRYDAYDTVCVQAGCRWVYDHRGIEVVEIHWLGSDWVEVDAMVDRSGTVMCPDGERSEYAFPGPYQAIYVVELINDHWWVTDYEPLR